MPWTAPAITRHEAPAIAEERDMLEAWLDYHRETLLWKCSGLTAEQLRLRTAEPSNLSLLGLVRHMAEVERSWFGRRIGGKDLPFLYCTDAQPDGDFENVDDADAEAAFAAYQQEVQRAKAIVRDHDLDSTFFHTHRKIEMSVRWVYVHMIEEYARHNGHADLIRERLDGVTGD